MLAVVTGANGFIGGHLSRVLGERGWEVRGLTRQTIDYRNPSALRAAMDGAIAVFHCAGRTRAPRAVDLDAANVDLTRSIIRSLQTTESVERAGPRLVFVSSQAAAGPAATTEDDPSAPIEDYGRSKLAAERLVRDEYADSVIVRPSAVYGPADRDFVELFRLAKHGVAIHPGNRDQRISIVHVDDLVEGLIAAGTTAAAAGRTYFLANDEPTRWSDLYVLAAEAARRRLWLDVNVPRALVDAAARLGDIGAMLTGRASLITSRKVALSKPDAWVASPARAKRELGFQARVPLQVGMRATYHWYLTHGWL